MKWRVRLYNSIQQVQKEQKRQLFRKVVTLGMMSGLIVHSTTAFADGVPIHTLEIEKEVIVFYKNDTGKKTVLSESEDVDHEFASIPAVSATLTTSDIAKLESDPNIAYIEENIKFKAGGDISSLSVSFEENQWGFQTVNGNAESFTNNIDGTGVKVAVIDSGIAPHSDLVISGGVSTIGHLTGIEPESELPSAYNDTDGHGTHIAGIIAAQHNGVGTVGVAPGVELYAVKVMDDGGYLQDVLEGIDWAIQNDMDIINLSLGTDTRVQAIEDILNKAYSLGIIAVAAAGNDSERPAFAAPVLYPAAHPNVIAVSAINESKVISYFSNSGAEIDVTAPGVSILSTYLNGAYAIGNGTSQAAPHVTGILALLKQEFPTMTVDQLRTELVKRVEDLGPIGYDFEYGHGLVKYSLPDDHTAPSEVSNITVSGITHHSAFVSFTEPMDSDFVKAVIYGQNGLPYVTLSKGENSYAFSGLMANATYDFYIRTFDALNNGSIGQAFTFRTAQTPALTPVMAPAPVPDGLIGFVSEDKATGVVNMTVNIEQALKAIEKKGADFVLDFSRVGNQTGKITLEVAKDVVEKVLEKVGLLKFESQNATFSLDTKTIDPKKDLKTTIVINEIKESDKTKGINYISNSYSLGVFQDNKLITTPAFVNSDLTIKHENMVQGNKIAVKKDKDGHLTPVPFTNETEGVNIKAKFNEEYLIIDNSKTFIDVQNLWNQDMVEKLASRMIINGVDNNHFKPNNTVTLSQASALVMRSIGESSSESNVSWGNDVISQAEKLELLDGINTVSPYEKINRIEAIRLMVNALEKVGFDSTKLDKLKSLQQFNDISTLSKDDQRALEIAIQLGLVSGYDDGTFRPNNSLSRAQLVKILYKTMESLHYIN